MESATVTIGEAAELTGLTPKAIRIYETKGLVTPIERTSGGYRTYGTEALAVLRFIRQAKSIGLRLDEIGRIIDLQRSEGRPCSMVIDLLDQRLVDIDRTLTDLHGLRQTLASARGQAEQAIKAGRDAVICTIIEGTAT